MLRLAGTLLLVCLYAGYAYGMDCKPFIKDKNIFDQIISNCPGLLNSGDKSYCCYDFTKENTYCCTAEEFAVQAGLGIIIPVTIVVAIVIGLIALCISCLCCSCCPWYRRRHRGTVYGKVQTPVVQVIQPQPNPPSYTNQAPPNQYVPYPTSSIGMPQPQPPPYSIEAYAKQAPYNPAYPPPS